MEASLQLAGRLLEALDFPEDVVEKRLAAARARSPASRAREEQ